MCSVEKKIMIKYNNLEISAPTIEWKVQYCCHNLEVDVIVYIICFNIFSLQPLALKNAFKDLKYELIWVLYVLATLCGL